MADVAIVFAPARSRIAALEVTATLSEGHSRQADVTEHPMETGADAADHIRPKPTLLRLEGVVSDGVPQPGGVALTTDQAYAALERILDTAEPVTIATSLREYQNMVMTSLDVPRDARGGHALRFTASFKSVRLVQTQSTTILQRREEPRLRAPELGQKKPGAEADGATANRSALKQTLSAARKRLAKFSGGS
jgi:hypothetical protein